MAIESLEKAEPAVQAVYIAPAPALNRVPWEVRAGDERQRRVDPLDGFELGTLGGHGG